jgi:molecular chaperone GrpE
VKVNDRRRFDMEGNPREQGQGEQGNGAAEPPAPAPAAAKGGEEKAPAPGPTPREEALAGEVAALKAELDAARRRVDELARGYQAVMQDREDFKARLTRERERLMDVERGQVAQALLEAVDELDRSLAAAAGDTSPLAQGVRLIRDALLKKLMASGIERLEVVGQPFDPNVAEAADMEVTPNQEDDQKVVAEVAAGYRIKDKVIRPAKVKVARYVAPAQA